ncbi:mechanosensitive ion channel family protein [Pseudomonas fluorescens]|uniref:Small-conductance mechanosensitive channel n=1 Tax=Pseudomonas fluorescens TaxID=294 RepID=A0A5E7BN38_PSEFL|nr:mechanosensitive ion channel family protein [Pseudomonas fluorescens]VVN93478.1 hypothetical protein PS691_02054 [Pseudomonas fluorescens]
MDEISNVANASVDKMGAFANMVVEYGYAFGLKIISAVVFWIVGRWIINLVVEFVRQSMTRQKLDPTVLRYVGSFVTVTLNIILVIAILGYCGIETTSFAAILAAVGLAIGMAWSGLLANLAAGGFIIVLRPFKVGDEISAGGVIGTVAEIGLFATTIITADNVVTLVGNNKVFSDNIQNFSSNSFRRVELNVALPIEQDDQLVIALLRRRLSAVPDVLVEPGIDIRVSEITADILMLVVRSYCHNDHYWSVYFAANEVIRDVLKNRAGGEPLIEGKLSDGVVIADAATNRDGRELRSDRTP